VAFLRFEGDVQEIFDVQLMPARFPAVVEPDSDLTKTSYVLPDAALAEVARERSPASSGDGHAETDGARGAAVAGGAT
jgi:hypothetical protein